MSTESDGDAVVKRYADYCCAFGMRSHPEPCPAHGVLGDARRLDEAWQHAEDAWNEEADRA